VNSISGNGTGAVAKSFGAAYNLSHALGSMAQRSVCLMIGRTPVRLGIVKTTRRASPRFPSASSSIVEPIVGGSTFRNDSSRKSLSVIFLRDAGWPRRKNDNKMVLKQPLAPDIGFWHIATAYEELNIDVGIDLRAVRRCRVTDFQRDKRRLGADAGAEPGQ